MRKSRHAKAQRSGACQSRPRIAREGPGRCRHPARRTGTGRRRRIHVRPLRAALGPPRTHVRRRAAPHGAAGFRPVALPAQAPRTGRHQGRTAGAGVAAPLRDGLGHRPGRTQGAQVAERRPRLRLPRSDRAPRGLPRGG